MMVTNPNTVPETTSFPSKIMNWKPFFMPEGTRETDATTKDLKEAERVVHIISANAPSWPLQNPDGPCETRTGYCEINQASASTSADGLDVTALPLRTGQRGRQYLACYH